MASVSYFVWNKLKTDIKNLSVKTENRKLKHQGYLYNTEVEKALPNIQPENKIQKVAGIKYRSRNKTAHFNRSETYAMDFLICDKYFPNILKEGTSTPKWARDMNKWFVEELWPANEQMRRFYFTSGQINTN